MMKSNGAGSRSSAMKRRRLLSAAAVLLAVCLVFVGAAGATGTVPDDLPTADVTILSDGDKQDAGISDLNIAMSFTDNGTNDHVQKYGGWIVDFLLTTDRDMTLEYSGDESDGYLAGHYDLYGTARVPYGGNVTISKDRPLPVVTYGFLKMSEIISGLGAFIPVYDFIHSDVKTFICGVNFSNSFLEENGPVKVTLELRMINPEFLESDEFWSEFTGKTEIPAPGPNEDIMAWYSINGATLLENMDLVLNKSENYLIGESYTFVVTQNGALREWNIEYEDEDGDTFLYEDEPNPSNYTVQSLPITLKTPVKEGYDFTGWKDEDGKPVTEISAGMTGNKKYVATWTIKKHTVTFETNDGSLIIPSKVEHNKKVSEPPKPTKEGYRFENWYSDSEFEDIYDFDTPVTNPLILYANWTAESYTVTVASTEGGTAEASENTAKYGDEITLTATPDEGYSFFGWITESNIELSSDGKFTMPASDVTVKAVFKENSAEGDAAPPSSGGGGDGGALSFPRTTENGGLVDFGSSKVVKAVLLPEGSSGSVLLKVDTVEKWPKALETEYTFDISVEKLGDGMAYIHFEIPVSTLESLELTPADIGTYHLVDDVWVKLATTYEVKDGTVCYEAATDSFSPFKLVIEEGAAVPKEEETVPIIPPTETPDVPDEPEILPPIDEPTKPADVPETPAPILAVLAGLGAAVIVRRK